MLEQGELASQADDRGTRLGGADRLRAHDEHPTESLLELLEALRHGRRRDAELGGGRLERAGVDHGGERARQVEGDLHEAMLMRLKNPELELIPRAA